MIQTYINTLEADGILVDRVVTPHPAENIPGVAFESSEHTYTEFFYQGVLVARANLS